MTTVAAPPPETTPARRPLSPSVVTALLWLVALFVLAQVPGKPRGTSDASYLATVESLVHRGTFVIEESRYETVDKVFLDGHYVSSKPRMLPLLLAPFYRALTWVGVTFDSAERYAVKLLVALCATLPFVLTCLGLRELLALEPVPVRFKVLALVGFTLGSLNLVYAGTINNHVPAAACITWAAVGFRRAEMREGDDSAVSRITVVSGFLAALSVAIDPVAGLLAVGLLGLFSFRFGGRAILRFMVGAGIPAAAYILVQGYGTGSLLPSYDPELLRAGPESGYWNDPVGIDATSDSLPVRLLNYTVGHHGLFLICPFLLAVLLCVRQRALQRTGPFHIVVATTLTATFAVMVVWAPVYGGLCFGPRYFTAGIPLTFLLAARGISSLRPRTAWVLGSTLVLLAISQAMFATSEPWRLARSAAVYHGLGVELLGPPP